MLVFDRVEPDQPNFREGRGAPPPGEHEGEGRPRWLPAVPAVGQPPRPAGAERPGEPDQPIELRQFEGTSGWSVCVSVGVDVDVDVVDMGDATGEALMGGGGDVVALVNGVGGVDVDGDVGDEAVAEPANLGR